MSSTLFSRGVTSQMGSRARADRIDTDIHNLKVAAGEILGLKRTIEAQAAQIAALETALVEQKAISLTLNSTNERRFQDLQTTIKTIEESLTKRMETTDGIVSGIQKDIPFSF
jgi:hypothetical protein